MKTPTYLVNNHIIVNTKHKFVYVKVPKSACTSILKSLFPTFEIPLPEPRPKLDLHLEFSNSQSKSLIFLKNNSDINLIKRCLYGKDYYRFTCMRNPAERLISGFYSKIVNSKNTTEELLFCKPFIKMYNDTQNIEFVFKCLLSTLNNLQDDQIEPHFRRQVNLAMVDRLQYNKIFMVNSLNHDFEQFRVMVPSALEIETQNKTNYDSAVRDYLLEKYKKEICNLYKEDYDFLCKNGLMLL